MRTIEVSAPKFELYEEVIVFWDEREFSGKIVKRWLDLDDEVWWYQINSSARLYPQSALAANQF